MGFIWFILEDVRYTFGFILFDLCYNFWLYKKTLLNVVCCTIYNMLNVRQECSDVTE